MTPAWCMVGFPAVGDLNSCSVCVGQRREQGRSQTLHLSWGHPLFPQPIPNPCEWGHLKHLTCVLPCLSWSLSWFPPLSGESWISWLGGQASPSVLCCCLRGRPGRPALGRIREGWRPLNMLPRIQSPIFTVREQLVVCRCVSLGLNSFIAFYFIFYFCGLGGFELKIAFLAFLGKIKDCRWTFVGWTEQLRPRP